MYTSTQIKPSPSYLNGQGTDPAIPVKVQFRHMNESKHVVGLVNQMAEKLSKFYLSGAQCTVVVDETHHRRQKGVFTVKVRLSIPGKRLYVAQSAERTGMSDGVYTAIFEVFNSIERQLAKSHDRRAHHRTKKMYAYEDAA
jgi:ribosomal subunit interface protein